MDGQTDRKSWAIPQMLPHLKTQIIIHDQNNVLLFVLAGD